MTAHPANVSVTFPVGQAYDRVKVLLFRPFDPGKWFIIGFCAWLAQLGESRGFNSNFHYNTSNRSGSARQQFDHVREYALNNLYWLVPLVIAGVVLGLALWVLFTWLNSRGKFMFLHCVALNKAEIGEPWHRFGREGNSLFGFRIVLGLIGMVTTLPLIGLSGLLVYRMVVRGEPDIASILTLAGLVLALIALAIVLAIIRKFTVDFVVPIMFLRGKSCRDGWKELFGILSGNVGEFVLYILFQIVLGMAIGAMILALVLMTCCMAGCLMAIPYLGTVLLLPILAFKRSYSLYYLAQYGREFDVFPSPMPMPPTPGAVPPVA